MAYDVSKHFAPGLNNSIQVKNGTGWSYKGNWIQIYDETEVDRFFIGDFIAAEYTVTVNFNENTREILKCIVTAATNQASIVTYARTSVGATKIVNLTATVNNSFVSVKATPVIVDGTTYAGCTVAMAPTYHRNTVVGSRNVRA